MHRYRSTFGRYIGPLLADLSVDYRPIVSRLSTDTWSANCVVKYRGLIVGCGRSCFDPFKKEKLFAVLLLCLLIGVPMKQDACLEGQTLAFGLGSPSHVFQCRWVAQFFKEDLKLTNSELYDFWWNALFFPFLKCFMTKHARTAVHSLCTIKSHLRLLLFISYFHCFIKLKLFVPQEKDYFDPRKYYTVYFFMRFFYAQILNSHEWPRQNFPLQYQTDRWWE